MTNEDAELTAVRAAWSAYASAEENRIRSITKEREAELVEALRRLSDASRNGWVRELMHAIEAGTIETPVRFPLFREVLFPSLLNGLQEGEPGCAHWLAGFSQLLCHSRECQEQLPEDCRTEYGLLLLAMQHDPEDERARASLIEVITWRLDSSLHELPSGVLYDMDGASEEECAELRAELRTFETLVSEHGTWDEHAERIEECRLHFDAYPEYLAARSAYASYAEFLDERERSS